MTIEEKIKKEIEYFTSLFGKYDNFRVWVENINNGQKYIVKSSHTYEWLGKRTQFKKQVTIIP